MKMIFVRGFSLITTVREFKQVDEFKIVSGLCLQIASLDLSARHFVGLRRAWPQRRVQRGGRIMAPFVRRGFLRGLLGWTPRFGTSAAPPHRLCRGKPVRKSRLRRRYRHHGRL